MTFSGSKLGTKYPGYEIVVSGYKMTKKWVQNYKTGTKLPVTVNASSSFCTDSYDLWPN